ncbi:MAG TPA: hypothetical protein VHE30_28090 [Polyangiaceae bacterium]|nr:hypothetical protein [Polyangiaceae bacterium]
MGFIIGFLFMIAVIGGLFYLLVIYREVPGAVEQRLGVLEALPEDINKWKVDTESEAGKDAQQKGLKRETRLFHDPSGGGFLGGGKLVRQARYRNQATNAIVRVEPDEPVTRKRVRK